MRTFLKKTVRKIFRTSDYEVTRIWAGHRFAMSQVLENVVQLGFRPETVIDVGVGDGTYELYQAFPDARFLLIEPLQERRGQLDKITRQYNGEYVLACAGEAPGVVTLNVHPDLNGSSIYRETEGAHADGDEREVPVVTIDQVIAQKKLSGPYVLKIDAQGAELKVLEGAGETLRESELIILEVQLFELMRGAPQLYDVVSYMKELGYVVYDCFGNSYRPLDGALSLMDMVFVTENGPFRQEHGFANKSQRQELQKIFVRQRPVN